MTTTLVAERLAAALVRHGVTEIFAQSIPTPLLLACEDAGIRQITYRAENSGGAMADGYARARGTVAFVCAQNGPAAALLVAPLAEALKASIPLVALVQDVPDANKHRNAFQDLDQETMFSGVVKWVARASDGDHAEDLLDLAVTTATGGRPGPVVLLLPLDVLQQQASNGATVRRAANLGTYPLDRPGADPRCVAEVADTIAAGGRLLIVAGGGAIASGAQAELAKLQELTGCAVATTTMGKGAFPDGSPGAVGVIGYAMGELSPTRHLRELIDTAEIILHVGTRTNQNGTDGWKLFQNARTTIHLDIDSTEVGRNYEALRLVGDARTTLQALTKELDGRDLTATRAEHARWTAQIEPARQRARQEAQPLLESPARPLKPQRLMHELAKCLADDAVVVADASFSTVWTTTYLPARAGQRYISPRGIAGLGWGYPMALGAKLAHPDRPVVAVSGDGGFAHCWAELETAVRHGINVVHVVLNNSILGYQQHGELSNWGRHTGAVKFQAVDHAGIARAVGAIGVTVEDPERLGEELAKAFVAERPVVLDVLVDPQSYPPITAFDNKLASQL